MNLLKKREALEWCRRGWVGLAAENAAQKRVWIALSNSGGMTWCGLTKQAANAAQAVIGGDVRPYRRIGPRGGNRGVDYWTLKDTRATQ